jgi:hypothetical protein
LGNDCWGSSDFWIIRFSCDFGWFFSRVKKWAWSNPVILHTHLLP